MLKLNENVSLASENFGKTIGEGALSTLGC
ncbi:hypothetical protein AEQU1_03253 [Aequorivita sp. CIP111184]|nr:hypothetical protein AEQU1_03253 [Aequorivita sp. CIP111184]